MSHPTFHPTQGGRPAAATAGDGFAIRSVAAPPGAPEETAATLARELAGFGAPDFLAVHGAAGPDLGALSAALAEAFPGTAIHGATSCRGAMTEAGLLPGAGALAIRDPGGDYGGAAEPMGADPRAAAGRAVRRALAAAGREGEAPALVWLSACPGREEAVIAGIEDEIGGEAPILGGSAADDWVAGGWGVHDGAGAPEDGVVVSVLFPSRPIAFAFRSGYAPTARRGVATRVEGRRLIEIDGRPAREVYAEWAGGDAAGGEVARRIAAGRGAPEEAVSILAESTWAPLGRDAGSVAGVPFHLLAHPAVSAPDGALELFADLREGERVTLMTGSAESLVARAGRAAAEAAAQLPGGRVSGALAIFCGGCRMAVEARMPEVLGGLRGALGAAPFLGAFTFGEQGAALGGENLHGNLMISCVAFGD